MTRWALSVLISLLLVGAAMMLAARVLGRSGARGSLVMSLVARWLGAYVLWSFAGGLALRYGLLSAYDGAPFALLAMAGGYWEYVTTVTRGRERGLLVFVGIQFAWLVLLLYRNGML